MRILVTGKDGQVARALAEAAGDDLAVMAAGRPQLDIRDRSSIDRAIAAFRPDILVNAAAWTAVDKAESEPDEAFAVNRDGAANAAAAADGAGIPIIQLSTDYVFDGSKGGLWREDDRAAPLNIYGASKLAGERAIAAANPRHVILRTSWVYSPWGGNFVRTMLRLAAERDVVRVVADQHGGPTYAPDIADGVIAVARALAARPQAQDWRGVFHMTAGGETTWAGFAGEIFRRSARLGGPSARVEPISTAEYPTPAARPVNSRLDNSRFQAVFAHALPDWRDGVRRCVEALAKAEEASAAIAKSTESS